MFTNDFRLLNRELLRSWTEARFVGTNPTDEPITVAEKDLFDFIWVANPQLSPDGTRVAFTRVNVDEKHTGYETSLWTVSTSGGDSPVRMTNGKHDAQPRWSPDGKRIAFVRGGDKDETGKPKPPQIAMLPLAGGEAWILTDLPKGASRPVWSPHSKRIAFLSSTTGYTHARDLDVLGTAGSDAIGLVSDITGSFQ